MVNEDADVRALEECMARTPPHTYVQATQRSKALWGAVHEHCRRGQLLLRAELLRTWDLGTCAVVE